MTLSAWAVQAFGHAADFYLREVAKPGEFDRIAAKLLAEYKARPADPLTPKEQKLLASGIRKLREREEAKFLQRKHDAK